MPVPAEPAAALLVLNQYYWPGVEATAHLLTELCEALAADFDVTVVTGRLRGREDAPDEEVRNGVRIIRVRSAVYDRAQLRAPRRELRHVPRARCDSRALARPARRDPLHDRPADGGRARGRPRPCVPCSGRRRERGRLPRDRGRAQAARATPSSIGLLGAITRFSLQRADRVVAIGETMQRRLEEKGVDAERLRVIPNWVDTSSLSPRPRDNDWARENGLVGGFVVMHSGNVGHAQNLDNLIRATTFLRDLDDLRAVIVGFGARHADYVALAERLEADRGHASCPTSRASSCPSRSRRPTSTSSGSARGSPGSSSRAASTGSSPWVARFSSRPTTTARPPRSCARSAAGSSCRPTGPTCSRARCASFAPASTTSRRWAAAGSSTSRRAPTGHSPLPATGELLEDLAGS